MIKEETKGSKWTNDETLKDTRIEALGLTRGHGGGAKGAGPEAEPAGGGGDIIIMNYNHHSMHIN